MSANDIAKPIAAVNLGTYSWAGLFAIVYQISDNPSHNLAALIILGVATSISILLTVIVLGLR